VAKIKLYTYNIIMLKQTKNNTNTRVKSPQKKPPKKKHKGKDREIFSPSQNINKSELKKFDVFS
jgi:hypothetical protein